MTISITKLKKAKDLAINHNCTGTYFRNAYGDMTADPYQAETFCAVGAVAAVFADGQHAPADLLRQHANRLFGQGIVVLNDNIDDPDRLKKVARVYDAAIRSETTRRQRARQRGQRRQEAAARESRRIALAEKRQALRTASQ